MYRVIVMLMLMMTAVIAEDAASALTGTWALQGTIDFTADPTGSTVIPLTAEMRRYHLDLSPETMVMTSDDGGMRITSAWKVVAAKPTGIEIAVSGGMEPPGRQRLAIIVVLADGIVMCHTMKREHGMKYIRCDGGAVGLPPSSFLPRPPVAEPDRTSARLVSSEVSAIDINYRIDLSHPASRSEPRSTSAARMDIILVWPREWSVLGLDGTPRIDTMLTDTGESVILPPNADQRLGQVRAQGDRMLVSVPFRAPSRLAKAITTVVGRVSLLREHVAGQTLDIPSPAHSLGTPHPVPGHDSRVTIMSITGNELSYRIDNETAPSIKRVEMVGPSGAAIPLDEYSAMTAVAEHASIYTMKTQDGQPIPAGITVRFISVGNTQVVEVPITLSDIPLQISGAADNF